LVPYVPAKSPWLNQFFKLDQFVAEIDSSIYSETDYFYREFDNKLVTISSTYHNQRNLPKNYISNQKNNLHKDLQKMLLYGNPFSKSGGEFYKCFDRQLHVRRTEYDPYKPIIMSWDFNVRPYNTCTLWQKTGNLELSQIDEICLEWPHNTPEAMCSEFRKRYSKTEHYSKLIIYGDHNGFNDDSKGTMNWYAQIEKFLRDYRPDNCVKPNEQVVERGNFINSVFEKNFEGVTLWIGENCPNTINDLLYLKEKEDGDKLKELVKDKERGGSYQKWGHCSDTLDYVITGVFEDEYYLFKTGGYLFRYDSTTEKLKSSNTFTYGTNPFGF
jgi:hypothetical protein